MCAFVHLVLNPLVGGFNNLVQDGGGNNPGRGVIDPRWGLCCVFNTSAFVMKPSVAGCHTMPIYSDSVDTAWGRDHIYPSFIIYVYIYICKYVGARFTSCQICEV